MGAESLLHRRTFGFVIRRGSSAMSVDITNILRIQAGIAKRAAHGPHSTLLVRHHNITRIGGHRKPYEFREYLSTARLGPLIGFKHKDPGTFSLNHARSIGRKRPAGGFGHHPQPFPGLYAAKGQHCIRTAGQHHLRHAAAHHLKGQSNRVI